MEKMNQALEKMKMLVGMDVEEEAPQQESSFAFIDDFNRDCTLSTKQRLYGFAICLSTGIACTLLSMLVFFNPIKFGITFSFGNLLALGSVRNDEHEKDRLSNSYGYEVKHAKTKSLPSENFDAPLPEEDAKMYM